MAKKIVRVNTGKEDTSRTEGTWKPTEESKARAKKIRIFAIIAFVLAIGAEVAAIFVLKKTPINMTWLIVWIIVALIFSITGSVLWKKANRLDPASKKDKFRFFVQNQLGAIIAMIAFLPLVILIFMNKDMTGKQKGIAGGIAAVALVVAGLVGADFNPPSVEEYTEQTKRVEDLTGKNYVYWTKSGKSYHLYSDCGYINGKRTTEIFEGTVAEARELKNITDLCDRCARQAERAKEIEAEDVTNLLNQEATETNSNE